MLLTFPLAAQTSRKSVSAAEVNGTFRMNFRGKFRDVSSEIRLLALGKGRLRVAMDLIYPYTLGDGERTMNMGYLDGEASISADKAVYRSTEFGDCVITIKFVRPGTIKVVQGGADGTDSSCGFGHNVFADGTYRKVSSKKPKFDTRDQ
jgi:hypothetical protein